MRCSSAASPRRRASSFSPAPRALWIWGAGHVGRALVATLAPLPGVAITWVDTAPERFPEALPTGVTARFAADPATLVPEAPGNAEHLILTYSHALDLALCHLLLGHGFQTCGLIGSGSKWARFRGRLQALGHAPAQISRIACPIGDPGFGKHPQAIANTGQNFKTKQAFGGEKIRLTIWGDKGNGMALAQAEVTRRGVDAEVVFLGDGLNAFPRFLADDGAVVERTGNRRFRDIG